MTTKEIIECLRVCCNTMCSECRMAGKKGCTDELLSEAAVKLKKNEVEINNQRCEIEALRKELAERNAAPEWISVEERMPFAEYGESDNVLAVSAVGVIYMLYFDGSNWCYPAGDPYCAENKERKITHWMPLPKPPKKVKTYKDVFFEKFPKATITAMGRPAVCRNNIFGEGIGCKDVRCESCWNQPYPEEGGAE